jgi:hypothetical protein
MAFMQIGNRGGKVLIHGGYRYQKNRIRNNKIFWRCWRKSCRAPLQTEFFDIDGEDQNIVVLETGEHPDHGPDTELISKSSLTQRMVANVERDPTKPVKRVYNDTLLEDHLADDDDDDVDIPAFDSVRSKLSRKRLSLMPAIPHDIHDVIFEGEWVNTWSQERFLSHQDNDWGIAIFATDANLRKLQRCRDIYIDETFKTCPHPYSQFVTIHGMYHGRVLPFAMSLMTGKTVGQYRQFLQHIKRKVRQVTGHRFRPEQVITDFEMSLLLAIETELPLARRSACYFHFCQILWRKIQELGLAGPYARQRKLRKCLRKFMAIGYLPLALVRHNFRILATANSTARRVSIANRF